MAITVTKYQTAPALEYKHFFLEELKLSQRHENDNSKPPHYTLTVRYRMFAVDSEGTRHLANKTDTMSIDDYYALAMSKAATGDLDLIQAAGAIEIALARIVEDQLDLGAASVTN